MRKKCCKKVKAEKAVIQRIISMQNDKNRRKLMSRMPTMMMERNRSRREIQIKTGPRGECTHPKLSSIHGGFLHNKTSAKALRCLHCIWIWHFQQL